MNDIKESNNDLLQKLFEKIKTVTKTEKRKPM
jgi:hypothetical protein